jgi:D-alanyl-D-alanine endopeptidase (penicillin-binding protein 7)
MRFSVAGALILSLLFVSNAHAKKPKHRAPAHESHARHASRAHEERERPVAVYTHDGHPNIQAESAVVVDLATGKELYAKHADDVRPIASISKLMAMMVVLEHHLDLDGVTTMTPEDRDHSRRGARSRLPTGMSFTNRDLIHAVLMASDNRAVTALGRAVGLDIPHMTEAMNKKAHAMGLHHTSFGDPTGLDDRNRSTPREVAKMLAAAMKFPLIAEITRKATYVAHGVSNPGYSVDYQNTDVIARGSKFQVLAGKTGYTDLAGYCLAIAAHLEDGANQTRDVAMVFLGDHGKLTRFGDFTRCAQWVCEKKPAPAAGTKTTSL